jgi:hypothetical protein
MVLIQVGLATGGRKNSGYRNWTGKNKNWNKEFDLGR